MSAKEAAKAEVFLRSILAEHDSESEFCRQLGISVRTAKRWDELGIGPARTKIGRNVFYRRETVAAWLVSREDRHYRKNGRRNLTERNRARLRGGSRDAATA